MKVEESYVRRLTITEVPRLDPIRVMLEDVAPGQGRINIECWGQSWANFWGGMGKDSIAEFVAGCDVHYIAGKLSSIPARIFDPEGIKDQLKREVISDRRKWFIGKNEARKRFNRIEELDLPDREEELWTVADMDELMGPEWSHNLPEKPNPDYEYLTRIIATVKAALKQEK